MSVPPFSLAGSHEVAKMALVGENNVYVAKNSLHVVFASLHVIEQVYY